MHESDYIWALVSSKIENFKADVYERVKDFYNNFDNISSLSRQPILDLITDLNLRLNSILEDTNK